MNEEVADVLDRAHDELLVRGWCQYALEDCEGRVCALGALRLADSGDTRQALSSLGLAAYSAVGCLEVVGLNNAPGATIDDVLDAFRHAAKAVREEAQQ